LTIIVNADEQEVITVVKNSFNLMEDEKLKFRDQMSLHYPDAM